MPERDRASFTIGNRNNRRLTLSSQLRYWIAVILAASAVGIESNISQAAEHQTRTNFFPFRLRLLPRISIERRQPGASRQTNFSSKIPQQFSNNRWISEEILHSEANLMQVICTSVGAEVLRRDVCANNVEAYMRLIFPLFFTDLPLDGSMPSVNLQGWPQKEWEKWNSLWEQGVPLDILANWKVLGPMGFLVPIEAESDGRLMSELVLSTKGLLLERELGLYAGLRLRSRSLPSSHIQENQAAQKNVEITLQNYIDAVLPDVQAGSLKKLQDLDALEPLIRSYSTERIHRKQVIDALKLNRPQFTHGEDIASFLPTNAVVVDFLRYARNTVGEETSMRYGAVVLVKGKPPVWKPLGPADEIDFLVAAFQEILRHPGLNADRDLTQVLTDLQKKLFRPLESYFPAKTQTVIIAPDGGLNFVSFACLIEAGHFISQRWRIQYVGSSRDLRHQTRPPSGDVMEVFADPTFSTRPAKGFLDGSLERLPGMREEATDCRRLRSDFKWLHINTHLSNDASEQVLRRIRGPFILHMATHGLFQYDVANPLNRGCLALSTANETIGAWNRGQSPAPISDGILTASEIAEFDLANTWLVVLSACDTGLGTATNSEGVFGMRSSFSHAGAQNVLISLWRLDDKHAPNFFREFYNEALKSTNAVTALHVVQNRMLNSIKEDGSVWSRVKKAGAFVVYGGSNSLSQIHF